MRVIKFSALGLFGMFNHHIKLDQENRITIIHGPNGYGKTTILRLIDAVFSYKRATLRSIPFDELHIDFSDSSTLQIRKLVDDEEISLQFDLNLSGQRKRHFTDKHIEFRLSRRFPLSMIEREIPELDRIGPDNWRNLNTREILDFDDVIYKYGDYLPIPTNIKDRVAVPDWLMDFLKSVTVRLIEAQRLLRIPDDVSFSERRRQLSWSATVEAYSKDLAGAIESKLAESARLSQSLDRTFPKRLVETENEDVLSEKELRNWMGSIEDQRKKLMDAGLLDPEIEPAFQVSSELSDYERRVLSVWVKDIDKKLAIYDELAKKIDLFSEIINEHFIFKEMEIDKELGFVFRTPDESSIPPTFLSSGEQHELVLAYELLFKVKKDALVLIDEPELSLHIAWQLRFLKDIQAIVELSPFDVVIATHSPQIINERWDLTVKLGEPQEDD